MDKIKTLFNQFEKKKIKKKKLLHPAGRTLPHRGRTRSYFPAIGERSTRPLLITVELQLHANSRSMDENLRIQRFEVPPSASDFEALIESRNVPAVISMTVPLILILR